MTINELREKRNQAWEAAKAFVETKRDKDGLLSDEDAKTYAEMEKKVQNYGAEIERMEAMAAMDAQLAKPTSAPITEKPMTSASAQKPKTGRASDAYKEGLLKALRTNFRQVSNVLSEGVDAEGGYLVPEEYDSRLIKPLQEGNIFRRLGKVITTSGDRGTRSFAELKELFAGNGMVGFVAKERVDGKLVLPEAVKVLKMKASA